MPQQWFLKHYACTMGQTAPTTAVETSELCQKTTLTTFDRYCRIKLLFFFGVYECFGLVSVNIFAANINFQSNGTTRLSTIRSSDVAICSTEFV